MANANCATDFLLGKSNKVNDWEYQEYDDLKLFFGDNYVLNEAQEISIKHPTLEKIKEVEYGRYIYYVTLLSQTSLDIADVLWVESKIWYEDIASEWKFFISKCLMRTVPIEYQNTYIRLINEDFRDALNFFLGLSGDYALYHEDNVVTLLNLESDYQFTETDYFCLQRFVRKVNYVGGDYDYLDWKGVKGKRIRLNYKYSNRKSDERKTITPSSITFATITSSVFWKSGLTMEDYLKLPIFTVHDGYKRYSKIEEWNNTLNALYSGCLDTKKKPIKWEEINWAGGYNTSV